MKLARLRQFWGWLLEQIFAHLWLVPLLLSVFLSVVLIERKHGLFTASFLSTFVLSPLQLPIFLLLTCWIDLTLLQTLLALGQVPRRWFRLSPRAYAVVAIATGTALVVGVNMVVYRIARFLGDICHIPTSLELGNGEGAWAYLAPLISGELPIFLALSVLFGIGCLLLWRLSRNVAFAATPSLRSRAKILCCLWAGTLAIQLFITYAPAQPLAVQLQQTCLQKFIARTVGKATDWDRDGFGWLDTPRDFSPLDSHLHPFAVEIPNNGIDENGLAGDLTALVADLVPEQRWKPLSQPDVVLIIACSLRNDVAFGGELGPSVMPALTQLAAEGVSVPTAYSHTGSTKTSIPNIFCGSLIYQRESLVRDFKALGYEVAIFSAEDDHFASIDRACDFHLADKHFDASSAREAQVTTYSNLSSLMISGWRVAAEVQQYLTTRPRRKPLFLAVQLFTAHYPYSHDSPQQLVPHQHLEPRDISPARRTELVHVYRNAAANLDQQIALVLTAVQAQPAEIKPVIVFVADHGESLFDDGTLGHGLLLNDVQTHVPCIIANGWGELNVPLGHADLRKYLLQMLGTPRPAEPRVELRPNNNAVFQYTGGLAAPGQIAHVSSAGRVLIDFQHGLFVTQSGQERPLSELAADPPALALLNHWESLRYHQTRQQIGKNE